MSLAIIEGETIPLEEADVIELLEMYGKVMYDEGGYLLGLVAHGKSYKDDHVRLYIDDKSHRGWWNSWCLDGGVGENLVSFDARIVEALNYFNTKVDEYKEKENNVTQDR